ncbi:MAG: hypothetical protein GY714_01820 [Desulfobacterales bacterium]|nr:hypothetical protein [Desulfobacterales bacterium]
MDEKKLLETKKLADIETLFSSESTDDTNLDFLREMDHVLMGGKLVISSDEDEIKKGFITEYV